MKPNSLLSQPVILELTAVIVAVRTTDPLILTVRQHDPLGLEAHPTASTEGKISTLFTSGLSALPSGLFSPEDHRTLELGLRHFVHSQTGLELGYVEQLYTFGNRNRDPRERLSGSRVVSVAYLALVRESAPTIDEAHAVWQPMYRFLPWEDRRKGPRASFASQVEVMTQPWLTQCADPIEHHRRSERMQVQFGMGGGSWDYERVLDRYELLYEAGVVPESSHDREEVPPDRASDSSNLGEAMAYDHRRIIASALGRIRGKLSYRPLVFELLPERFTLFQLQQVVEALSGTCLHKQNFRRFIERGGLVEASGEKRAATGGRPAALFRFRAHVIKERPAPGVLLPREKG